jgi:pimeloyl-ACP methyl ester carboxylesterase
MDWPESTPGERVTTYSRPCLFRRNFTAQANATWFLAAVTRETGAKMPVIKAGAFDVEYTDAGAGHAVLLLHSSASGLRQWRRLVEVLQDRYRIIAVNLFGYGRTSAWPGVRPMSLADQAKLVAAVAALVPEPVALVGHSLGGAVALEAAASLSDRVRVLIAFEPILFGYLKENGPASAADEIAIIARRFRELGSVDDWNAAGELFIDYWAAPGSWAAMSDERKQNTIAMLPPVLHEWNMATTNFRALTDWHAIAAPVHLIHARDTRDPTGAIVRLLAKTYPDWHVHEMPSGGHMAPLSRPDLINPLIASILDRAFARPD